MIYKHILVAVDLTKSSEIVISKAVALAKEANAKLSFIYVDANYVSMVGPAGTLGLARQAASDGREKKLLQKELHTLVDKLDYPVQNTLVVMGDLEEKLTTAVNQLDADLLVCGHHHDFWSRLLSSVRKLVNTVSTDLLIVYIEK
ncbi:universal stress protein [Psychromonas antarctica]|uniref:universal stress protein n=1 Tax=Psychromonas antarctica TaxID=67573 RepID=UPI001EE8CB68|nr:universal stress protein [Psychromonas antarctica]MCG6199994.1 universal stress protein [Psychromonas antarctica]